MYCTMQCSQTGLHSCLLSVCIYLKVTLYRALQWCHFLADAIVFFLCNIFPWRNSFCKHNFSAGMTFLCGTQLVDHCYIYCTRKAVTSKCGPCGLSVLFLHLTHFFQFYSYKVLFSVFKNWFMLSVRISSYGCTWEVWRALKKLELLSAAPRATLTLLSCSPNFPRASITRYTHAKHEPILN